MRNNKTIEHKAPAIYIELILRIGIFGTFAGHGIIAMQSNPNWVPLITCFGFSEQNAYALLPLIGILDLCVAVITLLIPNKLILIWAAVWAFAAALSRPVSGLPFMEFIERSSNWAAPLGLLYYYNVKGWEIVDLKILKQNLLHRAQIQ